MLEICLPGEGHTLGCLLRDWLFENGASYAACIVPHPQDNFLRIVVEADDPRQCILDSISAARAQVESCVQTVRAHRALQEAATEE